MKKLFAILMVAAILFNTGGYDLFFQYLIYRSDSKIFDNINHNQYRPSDLVEVKVPVVFPAQAPQAYSDEFQAISGQIRVNNNNYDYAEIKITQDTVYLLVVPNPQLNKLVKANVLYGKLVNDLPTSNTKHPHNLTVKKNLSESEYLTFNYAYSPELKVKKMSHNFAFMGIFTPALEVGAQPPEA